MSKLKTHSGAKKRFRLTASGKIKAAQSGKRHNMIKRQKRQLRQKRGMALLEPADAKIVRRLLPYA